MLKRMATPERLIDIETEFGIDQTQSCRVFNHLVETIVEMHHLRLFDNIRLKISQL